AKDDGPDAADPVDVLVAVDVPETCPPGAAGKDRRDAIGITGRPPADQLRAAGDQFQGPAVEVVGAFHPAVLVHERFPPCPAAWSALAAVAARRQKPPSTSRAAPVI